MENTLTTKTAYENSGYVRNNAMPSWHVLWTRSNCERVVYEQLLEQGFKAFFPTIGQWASRKGLRYVARVPMFPGYLFLHHAVNKFAYIKVCKTKGLVRILGERWDRLATVPNHEIETIQKVIESDLAAIPHPYLREGQRVRVTGGSLANAEGILLRSEPGKGMLVLSIDLLQRSVCIEIDCTQVEPI